MTAEQGETCGQGARAACCMLPAVGGVALGAAAPGTGGYSKELTHYKGRL